MTTRMKETKAKRDTASRPDENHIAKELHRLTKVIERQTGLGRRFLLGLLFGLGTALGASVVATVVILFMRLVLGYFGVDDPLQNTNAHSPFDRFLDS